jgi:MYXO-CTERM domain-containing protein
VICEDLGDTYRLSGFAGDTVGIEAFEDPGDDPVDTDQPDDDDDGGCGCAAERSSGGSALLVLLVGAPLLVRRRQAAAPRIWKSPSLPAPPHCS